MVMRDELEFSLEHFGPVPWSNFLLNPRKLRGSDFLMRWSPGVWSEQQLVRAVPVSAMPPFGALLDAQACADITAWLLKGEPPKLKKKKEKKTATAQVTPVPETPPIKIHGDAAKGFCIEEHQARRGAARAGGRARCRRSSAPRAPHPSSARRAA